jgi:predicted AAA+ superfamily ATPase
MSLLVRRRRDSIISRKTKEEIDRIKQESAEIRKETDRIKQESARIREETERIHKQTERIVKRNSRQMGDLHRRFGEMAEHLVAPGIAARFNERGFHFDSIMPGGIKIVDEQRKVIAEVDLLLENGEYIIAIEVKITVRPHDVEHHIRRLEILREHRTKKQDKPKRIQGAIAGAIFGAAEKQAVIEAGFYALVQSGDTMKMDIPSDFVPREW